MRAMLNIASTELDTFLPGGVCPATVAIRITSLSFTSKSAAWAKKASCDLYLFGPKSGLLNHSPFFQRIEKHRW